LFIKKFNATSATESELRQIFGQDGIKIVFFDELTKIELPSDIEQKSRK
jgi:hypothetical protein